MEESQNKENGKLVLLVEDDPFLLDIGSTRIQKAGFRLSHFTTADEALRNIESLRPDIILLDLILPGMDGYQFLEKIKSSENTKNIPVVIISNLGSESEIKRGMDLGASSYLVKSNTKPEDIITKIEETLGIT